MTMLHYVHDGNRTGFNLALEQVVRRRTADSAFWLWRDSPSIVIGRHQDAAAEVNVSETVSRSVPVFRRSSGGGAVYHDLGVVNFTFVLPADASVSGALSNFIALLGLPEFACEHNDVLIGGRKIVGTAQMLWGNRRLFHGSLLYDADLDALGRLLTPPPGKLRRHGVASVRARVANLRTLLPSPASSADDFISSLRIRAANSFAGAPCPVPDAYLAEAEALSAMPHFRQLHIGISHST